ncbi:helix-turn-helix transcriptional regulator [Qipengyuania sp. ASV99]|uniref:helix-turn-helix transcriptional regulator n=1 Tax=Qipengyuania sp. ASV99 TaxID=3399681 RepID=UPI003A4C7475
MIEEGEPADLSASVSRVTPAQLRATLQRRVEEISAWAERENETWLSRFFRERLTMSGTVDRRKALVEALIETHASSAQDGIMMICATREVIFADFRARDILESGRWLHCREGVLQGNTPAAHAKLEAAIASALVPNGQTGEAQMHLARLQDGKDGALLFVRSSQLQLEQDAASAPPVVVLRLLPEQQQLQLDARCLIDWYGLTNAEAKLAIAFAGGLSLSAYSRANGISINTVRTQFAQVKMKLDAPDQAAVVRRVITAAQLR